MPKEQDGGLTIEMAMSTTKMMTGWSSVPWEWRGMSRILNWELDNPWQCQAGTHMLPQHTFDAQTNNQVHVHCSS